MPTYTYRCNNCGHQFDIFQHFTDDALTKCPECGKEALHKVYSPVGIVFKGPGFYCTDNHSPSGETPIHQESSAAEAAPAKASDTSSKNEPAPAAAPAAAPAPKTETK